MKLTGLFGLLFIFIFSSCVKNNPNPSWIKVEKWQLEANVLLSGAEGELNHNFTDAYVYVDEKLIGIFELPIKLPLLMDGNKKIMIYPAVRNNGISATKKMYPFCEPYTITANLVKNETLNISPVTRYKSICQFPWTEDFESAGIKFIADDSSSAVLEQVQHTDPGKTGNCGHISLNTTNKMWTGYSHAQMHLPMGGAEVYLEVDFKCDNYIETGVLATTLLTGSTVVNHNIQLQRQPDITTAVWKRIYIDLKDIVSSSTTADYFEQYIQAELNSDRTMGEVYIDNVKVIHFPF